MASSFIITFLLQHAKSVSCGYLFSRSFDEVDYNQLIKEHEEYKTMLNQKMEHPANEQEGLQAARESNEYWTKRSGTIIALLAHDSPGKLSQASLDPCKTQSFTEDFKTFFGNIVYSDRYEKSESIEINEAEAEILKKKSVIINEYARITKSKSVESGMPSGIIRIVNYKKFINQFSDCDCRSGSHKYFIYLKGLLADFIPAIILGFIIGAILSLIWKFNFKIRITN